MMQPGLGVKVGAVDIVKGVVVVGLLAWLISSGYLDLAAVQSAFGNLAWLAAGVASVGGITTVAVLRWRALLAAQRIAIGFAPATRLSLIGSFFSTVTPGGFTGDLMKVYYLAEEHPGRKPAVLLSIVADRALGLGALIVMAAGVLAVRAGMGAGGGGLDPVAGSIGMLMLAMAAGLPVLLSERVRSHRVTAAVLAKLPLSGSVKRLYDALHVFKTAPGKMRDALLLSLVVAFLNALAFYCFGRALGNHSLALVDYAVVIPLILLAVTFPIAPAGIGVGQAAALVLFQRLGGVDKAFGANVMTLYQFGILVFALAGAVLFLLQRRKSPADRQPPTANGPP